MKKWEKFSLEEIQDFVQNSHSYAQLMTKLGYNPNNGGSYSSVKNMVQKLHLDISHFTGQKWNKRNFDYTRFRYGSNIKRGDAVKALANIRGWKCQHCHLSEWQGQKITLEIHHKDGNSQNNQLSNLELLCPNCHALTENWRGKNIDKKTNTNISEQEFVNALKSSPNIRQALLTLNLSPKGANYVRANELIVKYQITNLLRAAE